MPSPASGELLPFGYQVIEITGHSDMWGKYRDLLVCKVCVTLHSSRNMWMSRCKGLCNATLSAGLQTYLMERFLWMCNTVYQVVTFTCMYGSIISRAIYVTQS